MCGQNTIRNHPGNKIMVYFIKRFFDMQSQQCTQRMKNGASQSGLVHLQGRRNTEKGLNQDGNLQDASGRGSEEKELRQ